MTRNTRDSESRALEERECYDMEYISPLDVPKEVKKDGYAYHWAQYEIRSEPTGRVEELSRKGWTLVESNRCSRINFDPLKRNSFANQYICYKGSILMERPEKYSKMEVRDFNQKNDAKIKALKHVELDGVGSARPLHSINSF